MHRRIFALLLAAALTLSLMACGAAPQQAAPPETEAAAPPTTVLTEPPVDGRALYRESRKPFDDAGRLDLTIEIEKQVTVGQETYTQQSRQLLQLMGRGTENTQVLLQETLTQGESEDRFEERYADGVMYLSVVDSYYYKGEMEQEAYLARFAPAVLLEESLYETVTAEGSTISFADPTGPEGWALPEGAEFVTASGKAELSQTGKLMESSYAVTYRYGSTQVDMTVKAVPAIPNSLSIAIPATDGRYQKVEDVEAIRLYDRR